MIAGLQVALCRYQSTRTVDAAIAYPGRAGSPWIPYPVNGSAGTHSVDVLCLTPWWSSEHGRPAGAVAVTTCRDRYSAIMQVITDISEGSSGQLLENGSSSR